MKLFLFLLGALFIVLVAYTDSRTNQVIFTSTDFVVTLRMDGSKGSYHTTPPTKDNPHSYLQFDKGMANDVGFHSDTMIITTLGIPLGVPNAYQYVKN